MGAESNSIDDDYIYRHLSEDQWKSNQSGLRAEPNLVAMAKCTVDSVKKIQ